MQSWPGTPSYGCHQTSIADACPPPRGLLHMPAALPLLVFTRILATSIPDATVRPVRVHSHARRAPSQQDDTDSQGNGACTLTHSQACNASRQSLLLLGIQPQSTCQGSVAAASWPHSRPAMPGEVAAEKSLPHTDDTRHARALRQQHPCHALTLFSFAGGPGPLHACHTAILFIPGVHGNCVPDAIYTVSALPLQPADNSQSTSSNAAHEAPPLCPAPPGRCCTHLKKDLFLPSAMQNIPCCRLQCLLSVLASCRPLFVSSK